MFNLTNDFSLNWVTAQPYVKRFHSNRKDWNINWFWCFQSIIMIINPSHRSISDNSGSQISHRIRLELTTTYDNAPPYWTTFGRTWRNPRVIRCAGFIAHIRIFHRVKRLPQRQKDGFSKEDQADWEIFNRRRLDVNNDDVVLVMTSLDAVLFWRYHIAPH